MIETWLDGRGPAGRDEEARALAEVDGTESV